MARRASNPVRSRSEDVRRDGYAVSYVLFGGLAISLALSVYGAYGFPDSVGSIDVTYADGSSTLASPESTFASPEASRPDIRGTLDRYCVRCHSERRFIGNLALDRLDASNPTLDPETWEKVITRLQTRTMPPVGAGIARPDLDTYREVADWLEGELDAAWAADPTINPGRIAPVHRLNRTEYNNAVNDLLGLEIDVRSQLPGDETADGGFDNVASALTISSLHMERYMSVARQLTRLATGLAPSGADSRRYVADDVRPQDVWMSEDLPLGSRGGLAIRHHFPVDGEYAISVRLQENYAGYVRGMGWPQELDVRLDGQLLERMTVGGGATAYRPAPNSYAGAGGGPGWPGAPEWEEHLQILADDGLVVRANIQAGPRTVGISFPRDVWLEERVLPQPPHQVRSQIDAFNNDYMGYAGVLEVYIDGPYSHRGTAEATPSREEIFTCVPGTGGDEVGCASEILARMARRAYRRSATEEEIQILLGFFHMGRESGGTFDHGIQLALERILIDPDFLLRTYQDPPLGSAGERSGSASTFARVAQSLGGESYALSNLEVASRLAFFLWGTVPDDTLLDLAEAESLTEPAVLIAQVERMFADPRARESLVGGFAAQWLNLRRLEDHVLHDDIYLHYDHNLRDAAGRETQLFIESTILEDRSVLDLLRADYTYVNERLARHYDIPNVAGSHFRRVTLPDLNKRGGLLGNASLLAVTSYPDRTSPVLRGKWILENILGMHAPPPPPGVDTSLDPGEGEAGARPMRERLEQHRDNPSCASCHAMLDPLGFALESYDAAGGYRTVDELGNPVDDRGASPTGDEMLGLDGLRSMLLADEEKFVRTVTAKLMAYALGRDLAYYDQPAVRAIARSAAEQDYRWSSLLKGIVESPQFLRRMRANQSAQ